MNTASTINPSTQSDIVLYSNPMMNHLKRMMVKPTYSYLQEYIIEAGFLSGGRGGVSRPQLIFSSELYMWREVCSPHHQITYCCFAPLGPNPERERVSYCTIVPCINCYTRVNDHCTVIHKLRFRGLLSNVVS